MDSRKDARAASAGSILISRLQVRGVAGVVTDGGFRDSPEIANLTFTPTTIVRRLQPTSPITKPTISTSQSAAAMSLFSGRCSCRGR